MKTLEGRIEKLESLGSGQAEKTVLMLVQDHTNPDLFHTNPGSLAPDQPPDVVYTAAQVEAMDDTKQFIVVVCRQREA